MRHAIPVARGIILEARNSIPEIRHDLVPRQECISRNSTELFLGNLDRAYAKLLQDSRREML